MAVMAISQHQAQRRLAPGMFLMENGQNNDFIAQQQNVWNAEADRQSTVFQPLNRRRENVDKSPRESCRSG